MIVVGAPEWLQIALHNINTHDNLNETDTRRLCVEPVLVWLGYNIWSFGEVRAEWAIANGGPKASTGAVDYALFHERAPFVLVEAKPLGRLARAADQDIKQVLTYCSTAPERPRWAVLTDGRRWAIYDERATQALPERLILEVDLAEQPQRAVWLRLLSPGRGALLRELADAHWRLFPSRDQSWYEAARVAALGTFEARLNTDTIDAPPQPSTPSSPPQPTALALKEDWLGDKIHATLAGHDVSFRSWASLLKAVAWYACTHGTPPLPMTVDFSSRPILTPQKAQIQMRAYECAPDHWLEINWSSPHIRRLCPELLRQAGLAPDLLLIHTTL